jgi:rRNA maturation RNase YbeY
VLDVPFEHELCRVIVHGFLHLIGYQDSTADLKEAMRNKEDTYLNIRLKSQS